MPTKNAKNLEKDVKKAVSSKHYRNIVAVIAVLVGILLILTNLSGIIYSVVGLALIYLGLKLFGYSIPIPPL
ncbi:MAG: hypothetical protein KGH71_06505 [Candidatus Micrarchaeota archaeon]|nr:hypothetical protein [Candidatus Micrarchaeota archaeon]MDE1870586.1 hypothetical protein [Candidatus Micrarchaeota archaeon]